MSDPLVGTAGRRTVGDFLGLGAWLALCFAAAGLGGYWSSLGLRAWYGTLRKPAWTPPNGVFGPVWTVLYTIMAVAAWRVWRCRGRARVAGPLALFGVQLALNLAWSGLFFGLRNPGAAAVDVVALWAAIAAMLVAFGRVDRAAGALITPYLLWVGFASALNVAIWLLNA